MGKILERSGKSVVEYLELVGWKPSAIYMVGVGPQHGEIRPMLATWGPATALYGWEAHPGVADSISQDWPGTLYPKAVSHFTGKAELYVPSRWKNGCSLFKHNAETEFARMTVDVTTLDDMYAFYDTYPGNGLLWLDCEGSELDALIGGRKFLADKIDVINVEATGIPRGKNWCKPVDVYNWLVERGFFQVWTHTHRTCIGQFDAIFMRKELVDPRFCACLHSVNMYEQE